MPRTTRNASKKAPPPETEPETGVTRRRTRNSLKTHPEESRDKPDSSIHAQAAPKQSAPAELPRRLRTRAQNTAAVSNGEEEPIELPKAKRQKRAKSQGKVPVRQSKRGRPPKQRKEVEVEAEVESEVEPEDGENEEEGLDNPLFFHDINHNILPERGRSGISLGQNENPDENHMQQEETHEAVRPEEQEPRNENDQGQPKPLSQVNRSKGGRKARQRQRPGASFDESKDQRPRYGSVELGSHRPSPRAQQPVLEKQQDHSAQAKPTMENKGDDATEFNEDVAPEEEEEANNLKTSTAKLDQEDEEEEAEIDDSMVVEEDSLFIHAPQEDDKVILTEVASKWATKLTSLMERDAWVGTKEWTRKFYIGRGKTKEAWLNRQDRYLHLDQFRVLFRTLYSIREICREAPRAPLFKEQFEYMREHEGDLGKSFKIIRSLIDSISTNMQFVFGTPVNDRNDESDWGDLAYECLCKKIIPMIIHVLEESFKLGGVVTLASGKEAGMLDKCRFTSTTLQLPIFIMGWLRRLYTVINIQISVDFPQTMVDPKYRLKRPHNQRKMLAAHLQHADNAIQQGMDQLDHLAEAPHREMEAREKKLALQLARDKEEEEQREADERQMELFVKSIRRMNGSTPVEAQVPAGDDYSEKHEGWFYHEDDALLSMIRKIRNPNLGALVPLVPTRSEEEVVQRVVHLRTRMRAKYEARGEVPPLWCYPPE